MEAWLIARHAVLAKILPRASMQRLRRLHQLGTACMVWNVWHTRYDHSVGVAVLASLVCDRLRQHFPFTRWDVDNVVIAALCHDVGHGPFSHTYDATVASESGMDHEARGMALLRDELTHIGEDARVGWVLHMLAPRIHPCPDPVKRVLGTVVKGGTVDVDRLDYVHRDLSAFGMCRVLPRHPVEMVQTSCVVDHAWRLCDDHARAVEFGRFWLHSVVLSHPWVIALDDVLGRHMRAHRTSALATDADVLFEYEFRMGMHPIMKSLNSDATYVHVWRAHEHLHTMLAA